MPSLIETLIDYESDLLDMIVEQWGLDQDMDPGKNKPKQISNLLANEELTREIIQALPQEALSALIRLTRNNGRLLLDQFKREFGNLREMGAARREKLRPDRHPASTTEILFYKGLIARAFFKEGKEPLEFVYIPDEFLHVMENFIVNEHAASNPVLPGYRAERIFKTDDYILEHACTFLAALRAAIPIETIKLESPEIAINFLQQLLTEAGLLNTKGQAQPKKIGAFLEAPHARAFTHLVRSWRNSQLVDETQLLADLEFEGSMKINPFSIREKVLSILIQIPNTNWLDISEFCTWVKTFQPDLFRTGGEYDSWIIKNSSSGQYVKGFESWDQVEGELLTIMITGPLFWMGMVDLGARTRIDQPTLFRPSRWMSDLLAGDDIQYKKQETEIFVVNKDGSLSLDKSFPLSIRYQIARFCKWNEHKKGKYHYQINHTALQKAIQQGLQVGQLITLINKYGKKPVPPYVTEALERWKQNDLEAFFESVVLLRARSAAILDQLMASRAKAHILARLNDSTAIVKRSSVIKIKDALLDLGIIADVRLEV